MGSRTPPRYVPTLTEVVQVPPPPVARPAGPAITEEQWVHRIMQRVDMTLERRLREAIAAVVVEQTRNLAPLVRQEVEAAVREAVARALEEELQSTSAAGKSST